MRGFCRQASSSQALEKLRDLYTKSGADTALETICARPTTKLGWGAPTLPSGLHSSDSSMYSPAEIDALGAGTRVVAAALVLYLARRYGAAPAMRMVTAVRDKLPALPVVRTNQRPKHFRAFAQDWHLRKT